MAYGQERRKTLHLAKVPRMAEFAVTVCASLEYFGYRPEQTLSVLLTNRAEIAMEAIESNSVGRALKAFMTTKQMWRGTATKLLSLLGQFVPDEERRSIYWPKVANILGKEINRLAPSLKLEGIEASSHRVGKSREIVLIRDSFNPDVLSHPSLSSLGIFGSTRATEVTSVTTMTTVSGSGDL